jgi:Cof subfamily protein (haloacid dehalogenase superfamily)
VRLVASDLDGTLLLPDLSLSDRTARVLRTVAQAGIVLVLVTARPPRVVRPIARQLQVQGLAICANGALIYDLDRETVVQHTACAPAVVERLVVDLRAAAPGVRFAFELGEQYGHEPHYADENPAGWSEAPLIDDALVLCQSPVTKLLIHHPEIERDMLLELTRRLGGDAIGATHSGASFVEVSAAGVHKAWALEWLAGSLGISREDVVAFGDMPNDLAMLQWAGRGVAVANAHADLLAAADEVTLSCTEDGVAVTLERLLRERELPLCGRVG